MTLYILIALAVAALFGPAIIYSKYIYKMDSELKMLFCTLWFLLAFAVISAVDMIIS